MEDGALTMRMGIVCVCEGDGISAGDAVDQLAVQPTVTRPVSVLY